MSRLSLLIGVFLATSVTSIIMLMAVTQNVASTTIIYRGTVIFFIFGFLGTFFGSVLEVMFMPLVEEQASINLQKEISGEDHELQADLGDLLEECKVITNQTENGTPTDESKPESAVAGSNPAVVS
ncbi:MAG: hypothetical protein II961_06135 [Candidatus Riflebacteria bacterium]|jgi:vacuolar-type H+-ATPase subunit I/STV1|nr:hypothetical protein [Candidatus Riflebacteria bacterium]